VDLVGTLWKITIPGGNPSLEYVRLLPSGQFAYSYDAPGNLRNDGSDRWALEGGVLRLIWNGGYNEEIYPLGEGPLRRSYRGSKSSGRRQTVMERLAGGPP
jgi:hypothetical protein